MKNFTPAKQNDVWNIRKIFLMVVKMRLEKLYGKNF